jgi:hypothetical protein
MGRRVPTVVVVWLAGCQIVTGLDKLAEHTEPPLVADGASDPDADPGDPFADAALDDIARPDIDVPDGSFLLDIVATGATRITSTPPLVDCGPLADSGCVFVLDAGADYVLSATCSGDFMWSLACAAAGSGDCRVVMDSDKNVRAICRHNH